MATSRTMPTGARLVAAIVALFCCLAMVYVLIAYKPELELEKREQGLLWVFGAVGLLHGWYGLGRRASAGTGSGIMLGMRSAITVFFWLIFVLSVIHVFERILDRDLVGADPIQAIFQMFEHAGLLIGNVLDPVLIGIFLGTGIFCGMVTRAAARRWD